MTNTPHAALRHTPTPWSVLNHKVLGLRIETDTQLIATVHDGWGEAQANAEFIVRAVNNHEALVAALRCVVAALTQPCQTTDTKDASEQRLRGLVDILRGDARMAVETANQALSSL